MFPGFREGGCVDGGIENESADFTDGVNSLLKAWRGHMSDGAPEQMDFMVVAVLSVVMVIRVCSLTDMGRPAERLMGSS